MLKPGAETGKDAFIEDYPDRDYRNRNFGTMASFTATAWTAQGTPLVVRSLIEFDLSSVPRNATVSSARLLLYHCIRVPARSGQFEGHSTLSGENGSYLQRIITDWDEMGVTWNTQPRTTIEGQVEIPTSTDPKQDYLIDVTRLVQGMVEDPTTNHGFMLRLREESFYRRLTFASSDFEDPALFPELLVHYALPGGNAR